MKIDVSGALQFVKASDFEELKKQAIEELKALKAKTKAGNDFLGWMHWGASMPKEEIEKIKSIAKRLQSLETIVVIGIGGSYLGAKAVIDAFKPYFTAQKTEVVFAGQNLDEVYINELKDYLKNRNFGIIVISKSGTTLEPAVAFRLLFEQLVQQFGEASIKDRVVAITDENKGALRSLVNAYGIDSFVVPDDVGGRYSVLTPVGLLPIAVAGVDIDNLLQGAIDAEVLYQKEDINNPAIQYATIRNILYHKSYTNEVMVYSVPKLNAFIEWWKQLYGESEGKDHKGIFPVSLNITTDLHSLGQFVQDGTRNLFETFIRISEPKTKLQVNHSEANYDGLNYLTGKGLHYINKQAEKGTIQAHSGGGVPIIEIEIDKIDEKNIGELIFFFEIACGISGYLLGVNPFDQPGVEAYKKNMFSLLGK
ncbi:MAG: glucose-6-phosphate isomerase [Bacteroidales bacterium]|nr:glucose-6-phosphate isomerase [Bacteroidales bacterium]